MTRIYIIIGLIVAGLLLVGGTLYKWNSMKEQISTLSQDKATLETLTKSQKDTIALLNQDKERVNKLIEARRIEQQELDKSISSLKKAISGLNSKEAMDWKQQVVPNDILQEIQK